MLAAINYWSDLRENRSARRQELAEELRGLSNDVMSEIAGHDDELTRMARSPALLSYVRSRLTFAKSDNSAQTSNPGVLESPATLPVELQVGIAAVLGARSHFANLTLYDVEGRPLLLAERSRQNTVNPFVFRTSSFLPDRPPLNKQIWDPNAPVVLHSRTMTPTDGATLCSTIAVLGQEQETRPAALIGELKLESLFDVVAKRWEVAAGAEPPLPKLIIVLDQDGRILYHPNEALKHQLVGNSFPAFMQVATRMLSGQSGFENFFATTGDEYDAVFGPLPELGVSVAVAASYPQPAFGPMWSGWAGIVFSLLIAAVAATLLTYHFQRTNRGFERLKEGVAAIAKGELDHRIEIRSEDKARPLADNVNLMTKRLREQIARETEAKQFDSFVKLSALLTHDLKNAIEALSLIVGNMERHFDNEEFRADALKALASSTEKLRSLVARLSSPVTTLSGEHRRAETVDLVPSLRRVVLLLGEPLRGVHEINLPLPETLYALADGERIEKVIENLVLNALEAMDDQPGTLTVEAGVVEPGRVFFSISDTGRGMSQEFISERLFRPFSTTKQSGVGLGMYTCREVVRAHEGSITVVSTEGVGTTFRVVLPSPPLEGIGQT